MAGTLLGNVLKQGTHPDPLDPNQPKPDMRRWPAAQRRAWSSREMELFRGALRLPGRLDVRAAVLDDLSAYTGFDPADCLRRCIDWETWSVEEWHAQPRRTADEIAAFYHTTHSWMFDLLWYAYLQAEGYARPKSAAVACRAPRAKPGYRHVDFGAGVGVTSQLFHSLGYETELADVSTTLLAFARFRLERRGAQAGYIDLNVEQLQPDRYNVITAIDTLVHVPDLASTAQMLHRALRPGGYLFANFDVRPKTPENAWHLYSDDLPLRWTLQRIGFEPDGEPLGRITRYRKTEPVGVKHQLRGLRDTVLLRAPTRRLARLGRAGARSAVHAIIRH